MLQAKRKVGELEAKLADQAQVHTAALAEANARTEVVAATLTQAQAQHASDRATWEGVVARYARSSCDAPVHVVLEP